MIKSYCDVCAKELSDYSPNQRKDVKNVDYKDINYRRVMFKIEMVESVDVNEICEICWRECLLAAIEESI